MSGSLTPKDKKAAYARIASGEIDLVVGTHAVLQEGVSFHRLGLGIVDEQHRFGVKQRAVLRQKGENPHLLVMTATPIPRTLALTLYGDLSLSVIDEMPPGRHPVKTISVMDSRRSEIYSVIRKEIVAGRQAYIVYPLVEESEKSDLQAATVAAEQLQEISNMINLRFGPNTWREIMEERARRIQEAREAQKQAKKAKAKANKELMAELKMIMLVLGGLLIAFAAIGAAIYYS